MTPPQKYVLEKIKKNKHDSAGMVDLLKTEGDYKTAKKISECSSQVTFVGYVNNPSKFRVLTHRCGDSKLCKMCGEARKHKLSNRTQSKIDATGVHEMHTRHYVLSIDNTTDMEEGFNSILRCKSELSTVIRERKLSEFYNVDAYIGSIEISRNDAGEYHPHIHLITFSFNELNDKKLRGGWRKIARKVAGTTANIETPEITSTQHLKNITAYINKQPKLLNAELIEYKRITKHKNLFFTGGFLYGVPVPDNKLSDDTNEHKTFSFYEVGNDGASRELTSDTCL